GDQEHLGALQPDRERAALHARRRSHPDRGDAGRRGGAGGRQRHRPRHPAGPARAHLRALRAGRRRGRRRRGRPRARHRARHRAGARRPHPPGERGRQGQPLHARAAAELGPGMATVLIVDDEKNIREHLATYVRSLRHRAEVAPEATAALALLEQHEPDVIFSDVRMAGMDGLALLREIRRRRPDAVVVLMTAYATVAQAVEAMRAGAYDYLVKPFSLDQVGLLLARVLEVQALRRENRALRRVLDEPGRLEAARGGTIFLDEVGDLPPELQGKLLRFLEEHRFERVGGSETIEVDARVVAATNRDLEADVRGGRFREDLYFRLNVIAIRLPPLRERAADLPALTDHVLASVSARHRRGPLVLAPEARRALAAYAWPGNVRELVNT